MPWGLGDNGEAAQASGIVSGRQNSANVWDRVGENSRTENPCRTLPEVTILRRTGWTLLSFLYSQARHQQVDYRDSLLHITLVSSCPSNGAAL